MPLKSSSKHCGRSWDNSTMNRLLLPTTYWSHFTIQRESPRVLMEMSTISLFGPSQTLPLICEIPSKDNTQIVFAQVLKEMPLISQDLMYALCFFLVKGWDQRWPFLYTRTQNLCLLQNQSWNYIYFTTQWPIYTSKAVQDIFFFEFSGRKERWHLLMNLHIKNCFGEPKNYLLLFYVS